MNSWDWFWEWAIQHHIYYAVVSVAVIVIIGFALVKTLPLIQTFLMAVLKYLGSFKKFKVGAGGVEVERHNENSTEHTQSTIPSEIEEYDRRKHDKVMVEVIKRLDTIEQCINGMQQRMNAQYKYLRETTIQSGVSVVWAGAKPPFMEVCKAALTNIMLGENGNLVKRMKKVIIEDGPGGIERFESILNNYIKENKDKLTDHFHNVVAQIKQGLM